MVIVLVGNKCDLVNSREIKQEDGQSLAELEGISFLETSAKENLNVEEAFLQMITQIHQVVSQKALEAKVMNGRLSHTSSLQGRKEIIHIDEVSETKHASTCCLN